MGLENDKQGILRRATWTILIILKVQIKLRQN
jgi:hypothetical protein